METQVRKRKSKQEKVKKSDIIENGAFIEKKHLVYDLFCYVNDKGYVYLEIFSINKRSTLFEEWGYCYYNLRHNLNKIIYNDNPAWKVPPIWPVIETENGYMIKYEHLVEFMNAFIKEQSFKLKLKHSKEK